MFPFSTKEVQVRKKTDEGRDISSFIRDEVYYRSVSVLLPCFSGNNIPDTCSSETDSNAYFPYEYV